MSVIYTASVLFLFCIMVLKRSGKISIDFPSVTSIISALSSVRCPSWFILQFVFDFDHHYVLIIIMDTNALLCWYQLLIHFPSHFKRIIFLPLFQYVFMMVIISVVNHWLCFLCRLFKFFHFSLKLFLVCYLVFRLQHFCYYCFYNWILVGSLLIYVAILLPISDSFSL